MHKVLVFTDLHVLPEGETIIGIDPAARLAQGLEHALIRHSDASAVILTGDLTHHGTRVEYEKLKQVLSGYPLPLIPTLGNHDRRTSFFDCFPDVPCAEGFVQTFMDIDDTRLIVLDTLDEKAPDLHSGWLCDARLSWLDNTLKGAMNRRVILFMHHPPTPTGFPNMDAIALREPERLARVLAPFSNVVQIVAGHVHRTCQASFSATGDTRIPVNMFKSTCHQMPMDLEAENPHLSVDEPAAYGLLLLREDGVIVHTEDFSLSPTIMEDYGG